jgi:hypothetical protein
MRDDLYQEHFFLKDRAVKFDGSSFEDWWIDAGSVIMNRWAIDMEGVKGAIPVENLFDIPTKLKGYTPEKFAQLIQQDGLKCILVNDSQVYVNFE